jgi:hypothetical protein
VVSHHENSSDYFLWLRIIKGIEALEKEAVEISIMLRLTERYKEFENSNSRAWSVDEKIEILTRAYLREAMGNLLTNEIPGETLAELTDVLFKIVYPTYPKGARMTG